MIDEEIISEAVVYSESLVELQISKKRCRDCVLLQTWTKISLDYFICKRLGKRDVKIKDANALTDCEDFRGYLE